MTAAWRARIEARLTQVVRMLAAEVRAERSRIDRTVAELTVAVGKVNEPNSTRLRLYGATSFAGERFNGNESPTSMRYRRALVAGATYFFTVNLADRRGSLIVEHIEALREAVREAKQAHPFEIVAWVVLPEHMHAIWSLPSDDSYYSLRWNRIKGAFSRRIPSGERVSRSRVGKRERGIWQRRFWEHLIRDDLDLERHVD